MYLVNVDRVLGLLPDIATLHLTIDALDRPLDLHALLLARHAPPNNLHLHEGSHGDRAYVQAAPPPYQALHFKHETGQGSEKGPRRQWAGGRCGDAGFSIACVRAETLPSTFSAAPSSSCKGAEASAWRAQRWTGRGLQRCDGRGQGRVRCANPRPVALQTSVAEPESSDKGRSGAREHAGCERSATATRQCRQTLLHTRASPPPPPHPP